jgi:TolB-like protein
MPSIIEGYEYDIFISYRQNDNQPTQGFGRQAAEGWVTGFVEALRIELEATIKEPVSIYFDENPHDGLLETHQVDASLAKKLKCLVFIPIISQTYCDESSFAWQHEFLPFIKMAKKDELGMNITLSNGNVTSRVLPIKIHQLDTDDQHTLAAVLDGPLRSIDFIYSEAGVNRPLNPDDSENKNLNKTRYKNQINKVANALKDIGASVVQQADAKISVPVTGSEALPEAKPSNKKGLYIVLASIVIALLIYWGYTKFYNSAVAEVEDVTIAVLAFDDQSPNGDQEWLGDGMADEILNVLAMVDGLQVTGKTSSFSFKGKGLTTKVIGETLNVSTVLEGSVSKIGNKLRITAQLIDVETDTHIWSKKYDRNEADIFNIMDEVAQSIAGALKTELSIENIRYEYKPTLEAYNYYLKARHVSENLVWGGSMKKEDFREAENLYLKSISYDSLFAMSHAGLGHLYAIYESLIYRYEETEDKNLYIDKAKREIDIAYQQDSTSDYVNAVMGYIYVIAKDFATAIEKTITAIKINPKNSLNWNILGLNYYYGLGLSNIGLEMYEYSTKLDPLNEASFWPLAQGFRTIGNYSQAKKYVDEGLKINPNHLGLLLNQSSIAVMMHDLKTAESAIAKAEYINPQLSWIPRYKSIYYAALGKKVEALNLYRGSTTYLLLNMNEEAMQQLVKEQEGRSFFSTYLMLNQNPIYTPLRTDPRFIELLKQEKEKYDRYMSLYGAKIDEVRSLMTRK